MGVIKAGQHMIHLGGDKDRLSDCLKAGFPNPYSSKTLTKVTKNLKWKDLCKNSWLSLSIQEKASQTTQLLYQP